MKINNIEFQKEQDGSYTLHLDMDDELRDKFEQNALLRKFPSVEAYIHAVLMSYADRKTGR